MDSNPHFVGDRWIRGWPNIRKYLGYKPSKRSGAGPIGPLVAKYGFPLRHLPTGEPTIIISEVNEWLRCFSEASSPFRLRRLTGAALRAVQGEMIGSLRSNKQRADDRIRRLNLNAKEAWGGGAPPPDGPISPFVSQ